MAALRWAALALVLFSPLVWAERGEQVFITEYYQCACSVMFFLPLIYLFVQGLQPAPWYARL